jgi:predicted dehydrogenase
LIEKPAARTPSELMPVLLAAQRTGVVVKVGFNHRFHPAMRKARELVDSGDPGPLLYVRGRYGHGGRAGYEREWRCDPVFSGGGELIDQGSHLIDLSRWFLGDFVEVGGRVATMFWNTSVDDNCFLNLRTAEGRIAWLHASWTEWKNLFSFEIFGRVAKIQIDGLGGSYGMERLTYYRMKPEMGPPDVQTWEFNAPDTSWEVEFAEFASAVRERRQPLGNLHDALANLTIVEKLYGLGKS